MAAPGRQSTYTPEIADLICDQIADGLPLTEVLRQPGMPPYSTVTAWANSSAPSAVPEFVVKYARARAIQVEVLAEQILEIADDSTNDYVVRKTDAGEYATIDQENINRSRLRIDSRKWLLSKLRPDKYGDKLELSGSVTLTSIAESLRMRESRAAQAEIIDVTPQLPAPAYPDPASE